MADIEHTEDENVRAPQAADRVRAEPSPQGQVENSAPVDGARSTGSGQSDPVEGIGLEPSSPADNSALLPMCDGPAAAPVPSSGAATADVDSSPAAPPEDPAGAPSDCGPSAAPIEPAPDGTSPDEPGVFDDLVEDFAGESPAASLLLILANAETHEFEGFDDDPDAKPTPRFHLGLAAADLCRIVNLQAACSTSRRRPGPVRLSISAAATFAQVHEDAICELRLVPRFLHMDPGAKAVVYVRGDDLKAAANAVDDDLEIRFVQPFEFLHLSSGNFERPLVLEAANAFTPLSEKFIGGLSRDFRQVIPQVAASGIHHVAPHVQRDDIRDFLNGIDCKGGQTIAGRIDVVARLRSAQLEGLDLCFPHEHADLVTDTLYGSGDHILLRTEHFHIIRANELTLGIPRFPHRSKLHDLRLDGPRDEHLLLSRKVLLSALAAVHHAIGDDALVRLTARSLAKAKLIVRAASQEGASLRYRLDAYSRCEAFDVTVRCNDLRITLEKNKAPNVVLFLLRGHLAVDDSVDEFEALTVITAAESRRFKRKDSSDDSDKLC